MGRLIDTDDLNNQIMLNKDKFGLLSVPISNMFEDMVRDTPTADIVSTARVTSRPIHVTDHRGHEYDLYMDESRNLIFTGFIDYRMAKKMGWNVKEI